MIILDGNYDKFIVNFSEIRSRLSISFYRLSRHPENKNKCVQTPDFFQKKKLQLLIMLIANYIAHLQVRCPS